MKAAMDLRATSIPTAFCIGCDYPLNGLAHHQCPECGLRFDPAVPASVMQYPRFMHLKRIALNACIWVNLIAGVSVMVYVGTHPAWRFEVRYTTYSMRGVEDVSTTVFFDRQSILDDPAYPGNMIQAGGTGRKYVRHDLLSVSTNEVRLVCETLAMAFGSVLVFILLRRVFNNRLERQRMELDVSSLPFR